MSSQVVVPMTPEPEPSTFPVPEPPYPERIPCTQAVQALESSFDQWLNVCEEQDRATLEEHEMAEDGREQALCDETEQDVWFQGFVDAQDIEALKELVTQEADKIVRDNLGALHLDPDERPSSPLSEAPKSRIV